MRYNPIQKSTSLLDRNRLRQQENSTEIGRRNWKRRTGSRREERRRGGEAVIVEDTGGNGPGRRLGNVITIRGGTPMLSQFGKKVSYKEKTMR
jgi:hypothetical protein